MTKQFFKVLREDQWVEVELEHMTDKEREDCLSEQSERDLMLLIHELSRSLRIAEQSHHDAQMIRLGIKAWRSDDPTVNARWQTLSLPHQVEWLHLLALTEENTRKALDRCPLPGKEEETSWQGMTTVQRINFLYENFT